MTNSPEHQAAGQIFATADDAWVAELHRQFGKRSGDVRYTPAGRGEPGSALNALYTARAVAQTAWDCTR